MHTDYQKFFASRFRKKSKFRARTSIRVLIRLRLFEVASAWIIDCPHGNVETKIAIYNCSRILARFLA